MTTLHQAATMALDALEAEQAHVYDADSNSARRCRPVITALRAALAAPQAEPVGYVSKTGHGTYFRETVTPELAELEHGGRKMWTPVVAAQPAAPQPEPSIDDLPGMWEPADTFGGEADNAAPPAAPAPVPVSPADALLAGIHQAALEGKTIQMTLANGLVIDYAPVPPGMVLVPPGWMPIESAPKDGTEIIMSNGNDVSAGSWFNGSDGTCDSDGAPNCDERDAQWMDWSGGMQPDPTHWMPLPPPPGIAASPEKKP